MGSAGGGGIGVEFSLANLPKMLPGLILCAVFGWMALQWDATMSKWNNHFKEAEKVLKAVNEGKAPADYAEYKQKHTDSFTKKTEEFKAAEGITRGPCGRRQDGQSAEETLQADHAGRG